MIYTCAENVDKFCRVALDLNAVERLADIEEYYGAIFLLIADPTRWTCSVVE